MEPTELIFFFCILIFTSECRKKRFKKSYLYLIHSLVQCSPVLCKTGGWCVPSWIQRLGSWIPFFLLNIFSSFWKTAFQKSSLFLKSCLSIKQRHTKYKHSQNLVSNLEFMDFKLTNLAMTFRIWKICIMFGINSKTKQYQSKAKQAANWSHSFLCTLNRRISMPYNL